MQSLSPMAHSGDLRTVLEAAARPPQGDGAHSPAMCVSVRGIDYVSSESSKHCVCVGGGGAGLAWPKGWGVFPGPMLSRPAHPIHWPLTCCAEPQSMEVGNHDIPHACSRAHIYLHHLTFMTPTRSLVLCVSIHVPTHSNNTAIWAGPLSSVIESISSLIFMPSLCVAC